MATERVTGEPPSIFLRWEGQVDGLTPVVFENRNDDDADGIPDYADAEVVGERNLRRLEVRFEDLDSVPTGLISFHYHGPLEAPVTTDGEAHGRGLKSYWSQRVGRLRLWNVVDPESLPSVAYLVPNQEYPLSEFSFVSTGKGVALSVWIEGVNASLDEPAVVTVTVEVNDEHARTDVGYALLSGNLAVNNSNRHHAQDSSVLGELPPLPELPDDEDPDPDPCDSAPDPDCCRALEDWDGQCPVPEACALDPLLVCLCCFECCFTGGCDASCDGCCPNFAPTASFLDEPPLRAGIPDAAVALDRGADGERDGHDEALEDQGAGFEFWWDASSDELLPKIDEMAIEDVAPMLVERPIDSPCAFSVRVEGVPTGARLFLYTFPASVPQETLQAKPLSLYSDRTMTTRLRDVGATTSFLAFDSETSEQVLPLGSAVSQLHWFRLRVEEDLPSELPLRLQLVATCGERDEVVDEVLVTFRRPREFYWLGSCWTKARGALPERSLVPFPAGDISLPGYPLDADMDGLPQYDWASLRGERDFYPDFERVSGRRDPDKRQHLVFVHGYNVGLDAAEEAYDRLQKRFYWLGYRGNFIGLTWPGNPGRILEERPVFADYDNANDRALRCSRAVWRFLKLKMAGQWGCQAEQVDVFAHSLGNLVVWDAFRLHVHDELATVVGAVGVEPIARNSYHIEPAVWEDVFRAPGPINYEARVMAPGGPLEQDPEFYPVDQVNAHTWSAWFRQPGLGADRAIGGRYIHCYNATDNALIGMIANDWFRHNASLPAVEAWLDPFFVTVLESLFSLLVDPSIPQAHYFREEVGARRRGLVEPGLHRTPSLIQNGYRKEEYFPWRISEPIGLVRNPVAFYSLDARLPDEDDVGWAKFAHSDHQAAPYDQVFEWYREFLMPMEDGVDLPIGVE
ncbi:MAG: alpha/beta hydrolase [Acidobacteriota bacterium]